MMIFMNLTVLLSKYCIIQQILTPYMHICVLWYEAMIYILQLIPYMENVCWENFDGFHGFSLNCESFLANHGLFKQQYELTKMVQLNFYRK